MIIPDYPVLYIHYYPLLSNYYISTIIHYYPIIMHYCPLLSIIIHYIHDYQFLSIIRPSSMFRMVKWFLPIKASLEGMNYMTTIQLMNHPKLATH